MQLLFGPGKSHTCSGRLLAGTVFIALLATQTAIAQSADDAPAGDADFQHAIYRVEQLTRDLHQRVAVYQEHLQRAMENYGRGFYDPDYRQKLPGFDQDIRTGDPAQTEKIRRAVFASILITAGIHLDPDPLHDWAEVEKSLATCESAFDKAKSLSLEASVWGATSGRSSETLRGLRDRWQSVARQAEHERDAATSLRPTKLTQGQTFAGHATEGMNLRFTVFGIEFGRELGNVNALIQLTYCGQTDASHVFLLTVLNAAEQKTRTDTWVSSRALQVYSNTTESSKYGHVVTAQDHGDYRVTGARIADVAPKVHDWIWKSLAPPHASPATLADLEKAIQLARESQGAIDAAIRAFQQLALKALQENDEFLIAASANQQKALLPEQDLKFSYADVRAKLYAVRALSAGDPRFLAAANAVNAARLQAETSVNEGKERFGYFNAIATHTAPELPWKNIQKLGGEFMDVAEDVRTAAERANQSMPHALGAEEAAVTLQLSFIVEQVNRGQAQADQKTVLMSERILREVHWAVKGIPRREYRSELIEVSPTGLHRVQSVSPPAYIQGPGGLRQVFQGLSKTPEATF